MSAEPLRLSDLSRRWATERPHAPAMTDERQSLTWSQADAMASSLAAHLVLRGVEAGDRVALLAENRVEWGLAAIGVWKVGAVLVPLNTRLAPPELEYQLASSSPRLVMVSREVRHLIAGLPGSDDLVLDMDDDGFADILRTGSDVPTAAPPGDLNADPPVVLQYTSGTTGLPKAVPLRHSSALALGRMLRGIDPALVGDGLTTLIVAPLFFTGGLNSTFIPVLVNGGHAVVQGRFDAHAALASLEQERVSMFVAVPVIMDRISSLPEFEQADLSHLVFGLTGGAVVRDETMLPWHEKGVVFRQGYSLTEGGGFTLITTREEALLHPDRAGRPVIETEVRIVDEAGETCVPGDPGELVIRGSAVMQGYWNDPDATSGAFRDGWFLTGDIATMDESGSVQILGRTKDLIISGGINVYPAEVERILGALEGVLEVAVLGEPDAQWGEVPVAIIRLERDRTDDELRSWCAANMASYKIPKRFVRVADALPRSAQGKLTKAGLSRLLERADA